MSLKNFTPTSNLKIKNRKETSKKANKRNSDMEKITGAETAFSFSFILHSQEETSYI